MNDIQRLAGWLRASTHPCVFTGAGMSTESGLPDFRSAGGMWRSGRAFEDLASLHALAHHADEFVAFYRWRIEMVAAHQPHAGHAVLARWQAAGRLGALITQNVDGYHEAAGSVDPINLHGSLRVVRCRDCGAEAMAAAFLVDGGERCGCGGPRRPGVVLFGEALPLHALERADAAARRADLFIVLGSSLLVSPANHFPRSAKQHGAKLVIVNHDPTPLDGLADMVLPGPIGEVLAAVDALLPPKAPPA